MKQILLHRLILSKKNTRKERTVSSIRLLLLKFTQEYDQRHYFQIPPTLGHSICRQCVSSVAGRGWGGVESRWRPYSAGDLRSVCDQMQILELLTHPKAKILDGEGASKSFCRALLRRRNFALPSMCLIFLR